MSHLFLLILFSGLLLISLAGVVLPLLPGIPLMMLLALVFAVLDRFQHLQGGELAWLSLIALLSIGVDYFSGLWGAKVSGASSRALWYGIIGFIVGTFLLPPLGGFLGMFAGIVFAELALHGNKKQAVRAASGSIIGTVIGMLVNILLGIVFLGLFIIWAR